MADFQHVDPVPRFAWLRKRPVVAAIVTAALVVALAAAGVPALAAVGAGSHAATGSHTHATGSHTHATVSVHKTTGSTAGSQGSHATAPSGSATATPSTGGTGAGICLPLRGYISNCPFCPLVSFEPSNPVQYSNCPPKVGSKHIPCGEIAGPERPQQ